MLRNTIRLFGSGIFFLQVFLGTLVLTTLTGCLADGSHPPDPNREHHEDDLGRSVVISFPVRRIVTLAPSVTELVYAAGGLSKLVGVSTADDFPPSVKNLPMFSALPVNFEAIAGLQPDLVLATSQVNSARDADVLENLGIPVFFLQTSSLDDIIKNVRTVGRLLGTQEIASRAADSLGRVVNELRNATEMIPSRPRVLVLLSEENLFSFGAGSYIHDLITLAGGESITSGLKNAAPVLSEEFVLTGMPDVILGTFSEHVGAEEFLIFHPEWSSIPAIKNESIFALDPDLLLRPGPRSINSALQVLAILHPEVADSLN